MRDELIVRDVADLSDLLVAEPLGPLPVRPLVSVLIANYNYARYIGEAIESVLQQTYEHFEVVVCDDGSTDNSCAVVNDYARRDRRVRLIARENRGQASATTSAYDASAGQIICLLDADDRFFPTKLARVVEGFEASPRHGACIHQVLPVSASGMPISEPIPPALEGGWLAPAVVRTGLFGASLSTSGLSFRREIADCCFPFPPPLLSSYRRSAPIDMYMIGVARLCTPIVAIPDVLVEYRCHGANDGLAAYPTERSVSQILDHFETVHPMLRAFLASRYGAAAGDIAPVEDSVPYLEHLLAYAILVGDRRDTVHGHMVAVVLMRLPETRRKRLWHILLTLPRPIASAALKTWWGMVPWKRFARPIWRLLRVGNHSGNGTAPVTTTIGADGLRDDLSKA